MSNGSIIPPSSSSLKFLADQFARGLEELRTAITNLQAQVQSGAIDMAGVKAEIENMGEGIDELKKIVRGDNNGTSGVIGRLTTIENNQKSVNEWIESQKKRGEDNFKYRIGIKVAMIAGSFSLLTVIVDKILDFIK